jgi:hypothetical protein
MKLVTSLAFALAATLSVSAFAADKAPADKLTPQQQKLSDCAKDAHAKSLKGDEFKAYMSTCTKGSGTAAKTASSTTTAPPTNQTAAGDVSTSTTAADKAQAADKKAAPPSTTNSQWVAGPGASNSQQEKMKACATDAKTKGLKGNDRRTYMSTCLKSDKSTPAATDTPAATTTPAKKSGS